jgi:hypothetical protein
VLLTRLPLPVARAFDLHVLSLPPAFALSQDQTLKFWMRFEPAKSQRLTRFRHLQDCSRSPWVLNLKRVTAEVSSDRSVRKVALSRESGPQGLRRPRFSFFLFTCQTARGRSRPLPFEKPKSHRSSSLRSGPEAFSLISVRSFRGAPSRRGERRAVWAYIGPARFQCQHPAPKNVREFVTKTSASRATARGGKN